MFRCHSSMVVRSLTRWSQENFGAIFNGNGSLSFHPCSDPVPEGTVLISAPWMPSPCEGIRLLRSTRRLRRSATADLSRSTVSSTTRGSLARPAHHAQRSGSRTWSSSHRSGRGEVETLQFHRGGSDAERRGGVDVERATCLATRMFVLCQDVLSPCAIIPGLSWLQWTRPGVLPCLVDQEHYVKRSEFTACGFLRHTGGDGRRGGFPPPSCGGLACPTPSCTFENVPPGSAQSEAGRGHLEALQCHGVDVVGATCLFSAWKPLRCGQRRAKGFFLSPSSLSRRTPSTPSMPDDFFEK